MSIYSCDSETSCPYRAIGSCDGRRELVEIDWGVDGYFWTGVVAGSGFCTVLACANGYDFDYEWIDWLYMNENILVRWTMFRLGPDMSSIAIPCQVVGEEEVSPFQAITQV